MRFRDYGNWVSLSAITNSGEYKKEHGCDNLRDVLENVRPIFDDQNLYYAVVEFRRHGKLFLTFKINPANFRYTICVEEYDKNPEAPTDKIIRAHVKNCRKNQLIEKLVRLGEEYFK